MDLATLEPTLRAKATEDPKGFLAWLARMLGDEPVATNDPPAVPTSGACGYALCVGVNRVHGPSYHGWTGELPSSENDARSVRSLLSARGFSAEILLSEQATRAAVLGGIADIAARTVAGDTVVVFYSGHGGQIPELGTSLTPRDEEDGLDETAVLYDGHLLDDELWTALRQIDPGVRVVLIADGCHSGSVTKAITTDIAKAIPADVAVASAEDQAGALLVGHNAATVVRARQITKGDDGPTIVTLAACREDELAYAGHPHSQFTAALLGVMEDGFGADWHRLHAGIVRRIRSNQTPVITAHGSDWQRALRWPAFRL